MGALCFDESLMGLFVLILYNLQCRSIIIPLKGAIRFDSLPLLAMAGHWLISPSSYRRHVFLECQGQRRAVDSASCRRMG